MSIKARVLFFLIAIGLVMSCCIGGYSYIDMKNQIHKNALKQAEIVSSFAKASQKYTVRTLHPLVRKIAGKDSFHPEMMGGFYIARAIADIFTESQPGYSFKQAALDPTNKQNLADHDEKEIIQFFANNREIKQKKGQIEKQGKTFFYVAQPVVTRKGCLKCHGKKEEAPSGRVDRYEDGGGYNYTFNSIVATFITYVPIEKDLQDLKFRAVKVAGVGLFFVVILTTSIWIFLNIKVILPLFKLTGLVDKMSLGQGLEKPIIGAGNDEIGKLYNSLNRMRKSILKLLNMVNKQK